MRSTRYTGAGLYILGMHSLVRYVTASDSQYKIELDCHGNDGECPVGSYCVTSAFEAAPAYYE
jgi:hypothetical protein